MARFYTVIPLHHVNLDSQDHWNFANGFVLTALPRWCRTQQMLEWLSESDRQELEHVTSCFMTAYEAAALEQPDPAWTGTYPKSTQETKYEEGVLANFALWLSRPSPAGFRLLFHAPDRDGDPVIQQIVRCSPLLCHPRDVGARITADDVGRAAAFHRSLVAVSRDTAVWTALRAAWAGLGITREPFRYVLFWIALEALFGPDDAREITYRLAQRVAFFLGNDRAHVRGVYETAKRGYRFRSKIVHGRWNDDAYIETQMAEAEELVRQSIVRILDDLRLTEAFCGRAREGFLDDLVFGDGGAA